MAGETCTVEEAEKYQTYILIHLASSITVWASPCRSTTTACAA